MWTAIIVIFLAFVLIVGGIMALLHSKDFKIPKDYDPSKSGYDDEDEDDKSSGF